MIKKDKVTVAEILLRGLIVFAFVFVCTLIIFPFAKGLPVKNIPDYKDIISIEIYDIRNDNIVNLTDEEEIYYAVCCVDFLKTEINSKTESDDNGFIIVNITDKNGYETIFSADENYLYIDGKAKALKNTNIFVEAIEKLYFWIENFTYILFDTYRLM